MILKNKAINQDLGRIQELENEIENEVLHVRHQIGVIIGQGHVRDQGAIQAQNPQKDEQDQEVREEIQKQDHRGVDLLRSHHRQDQDLIRQEDQVDEVVQDHQEKKEKGILPHQDQDHRQEEDQTISPRPTAMIDHTAEVDQGARIATLVNDNNNRDTRFF